MSLPPLLAIVGPTGVGKTALAVRLAQTFDGEIVSADSRQFYRGMDIGTAKPTREEQAAAPHHLLDIADPDATIGLAQFQALARVALEAIQGRGKLPLLVGGTGQYVWGFLEGWTVPEVPPNWNLRERLYARAETEGGATVFAALEQVDPVAAAKIDPRNVRRVIRALEVYYATGRPFSEAQTKSPLPYRTLILGLYLDRDLLYPRLDARIDAMLAAGLADEVRRLVAQGYSFDLPSMTALGYGEFAPVVRGEGSVADAVALIKRHTRRFVRQQGAWFKRTDPRIHWLDAAMDPYPQAVALVRAWLASC
ncbi:MAG: tRNA (adenosine(37)-N6)-dimethylallyltransferase MiaA [Anaerolineae bacterium]|nr:tRNA (adenosine(37)-N6)-dimethylallyltransferase MiaA [Anaerolineae bacterium]